MQPSKFFKATTIACGVTAIEGLGMELCYLVEGSQRALLIDTLTGVGDLKAYCRERTDLPITVVNTHGHVDHCGGNFDFGCCYIHPDDVEMMYVHTTVERRKGFVDSVQSQMPHPAFYTAEDFSPPCSMRTYPVYDGNIFDLGERQLEVIAVPGHSTGSIVLLERDLRILFSGDACNANTLLFLPNSASIEEYLNALRHLKSFQPAYDVLYGGHGLKAVPASIVDDAIELCGEILEGTDDAVEATYLNRPCFYGKKKGEQFIRLDGKLANIAYGKEHIHLLPKKRILPADSTVQDMP